MIGAWSYEYSRYPAKQQICARFLDLIDALKHRCKISKNVTEIAYLIWFIVFHIFVFLASDLSIFQTFMIISENIGDFR